MNRPNPQDGFSSTEEMAYNFDATNFSSAEEAAYAEMRAKAFDWTSDVFALIAGESEGFPIKSITQSKNVTVVSYEDGMSVNIVEYDSYIISGVDADEVKNVLDGQFYEVVDITEKFKSWYRSL